MKLLKIAFGILACSSLTAYAVNEKLASCEPFGQTGSICTFAKELTFEKSETHAYYYCTVNDPSGNLSIAAKNYAILINGFTLNEGTMELATRDLNKYYFEAYRDKTHPSPDEIPSVVYTFKDTPPQNVKIECTGATKDEIPRDRILAPGDFARIKLHKKVG